eukprot:GHVR01186885.1.p1 GENE.GHVR01186885.1~~GHVR01186885.1.p1  ORF type:complete len:122 (+),score=14.32 GHVR01186885.1:437-802(+)
MFQLEFDRAWADKHGRPTRPIGYTASAKSAYADFAISKVMPELPADLFDDSACSGEELYVSRYEPRKLSECLWRSAMTSPITSNSSFEQQFQAMKFKAWKSTTTLQKDLSDHGDKLHRRRS